MPIQLFGEDTPELTAFYTAAANTAPGAWELLQDLLASWQPHALSHEWKLPDGFDAKVKVMQKVEARVEVDELDHATFSYEFYVNEGSKKGLSNVANVVHSFDAYVLRCMHRRCNYDYERVMNAATLIEVELIIRSLGKETARTTEVPKLSYYCEQYRRSGMADAVILPYLTSEDMGYLTTKHLEALATIANGMLEYQPFEVITIHDEFKCHPNNMNHLRQQYINIMAELADSDVLSDVLGQLLGTSIKYVKQSTSLGNAIRQSNYALS